MSRIIAGEARGTQLQIPKTGTRPTSDKVREAVFSRLEANRAIEETRVLDLYAGSGALGWEALSRGAATLDLVDKASAAVQTLKQNRQKLAVLNKPINIYRQAANTFIRQYRENNADVNPGWELIFIDPPYDLHNKEILELLEGLKTLVDPDAWLVIERSSRSPKPDWEKFGWEDNGNKKYGETVIYYLRPAVV